MRWNVFLLTVVIWCIPWFWGKKYENVINTWTHQYKLIWQSKSCSIASWVLVKLKIFIPLTRLSNLCLCIVHSMVFLIIIGFRGFFMGCFVCCDRMQTHLPNDRLVVQGRHHIKWVHFFVFCQCYVTIFINGMLQWNVAFCWPVACLQWNVAFLCFLSMACCKIQMSTKATHSNYKKVVKSYKKVWMWNM